MQPLERRVLHLLREHELAPPGSRGLVCVSGGSDSLALLHLLHAAAVPLALRLDVLHFDHGLRPESAREADWVAQQAAALGLPCHIVRAEHLAGRHSGVQAAARAWRLSETRRLAAQWDAQWAATGHQHDDHLETLLLKLLRGVHISRLQGMAWRSGLFVRPLLGCSREELRDYLGARGLSWLEDPSNARPAYKRNRVRNELLPLLDALTLGGARPRLEALEAQSTQVAELLRFVAAQRPVAASGPAAPAHWIDAAALAALPALAAAGVLHEFVVARLPGALDAAHVEHALRLLARGAPAWTLHLSHGRCLMRRGARLLLAPQREAAAEPTLHALGAWRIRAPLGWAVAAPAGEDGGVTLYNVPPQAELHLRRREPGDRFHPPWKRHPVKLSAFLRDQHVPLWEREALPLVLLEGQVIAVYPRFVAQGYALPEEPQRAAAPLRLEVRTA
jgi:tRNA(Ile)-lysidine synthase